MPKKLRIVIRELGCAVYARKRTTGRYNCSYEIRFNRGGFKISASGRTKEEAKQRFIEKAKLAEAQKEYSTPAVPKDFDGFAMYWFENFHKRKVGDRTYDHDIKLYNRHIVKRFGKLKLNVINAVMLQRFLDEFADRPKTAKDLFSILNQILNCAVKHGQIKLNPLGMCFVGKYEQEHGTLITKDEEERLLGAFEGTPYQVYFAVVHYCGLRPNEYCTAVINGKFIKAVNSKRHNANGKVEYKFIPITPMLRPYLENIETLVMPKAHILEDRFKKILPNHKLYDMRTTFQTRCSECGVNETVIGLWMGNSIGKLKEAYTDFSEEYLLSEAEKFRY